MYIQKKKRKKKKENIIEHNCWLRPNGEPPRAHLMRVVQPPYSGAGGGGGGGGLVICFVLVLISG